MFDCSWPGKGGNGHDNRLVKRIVRGSTPLASTGASTYTINDKAIAERSLHSSLVFLGSFFNKPPPNNISHNKLVSHYQENM